MTTGNHDVTGQPAGTWLPSLIGELLGVDVRDVPADRPLGELGIDSLTAAQLSVEVEERTGVNIPLERFLGDERLDDLIREVEHGPAGGGVPGDAVPGAGPAEDTAPGAGA
ncbi:acyl carrier protein [Streptomyces sp. TRM 70351]|uniref:acyl carrier protein n=1 Tax=Streptomyces sp. TRM 70351 TaxID=3116552 RepID=UPI002E7B903D|nr:acyl carrier protein [Streptomyces sp. TRM 70351]MEE1930306.1 acyl carrier protein [Streptomyces sp. TRM 70351]